MEHGEPNRRQRVVITGLGAISPLGTGARENWESAIAGRSGIAPISRFDATAFSTRFAGEVRQFDPGEVIGRKESRRMDRHAQFAVVTAAEAMSHAGFASGGFDPVRTGVLVGTGMGAMETFEQGAEVLATQGPSRLSPF